MGLFGKIFEKKECAFCGKDIGMLGNRKLEDGNMCKECAAKLSPWFSERRHSTVEDIRKQLEAREANKAAVASFRTARTLGSGSGVKVFVDDNAQKFMVAREKELTEGNPDVIDFSQVTDVIVDVKEDQDEQFRSDDNGDRRSYYPPRYIFRYDIKLLIYLRHPYLDEIEFSLNQSSIVTNRMRPLPFEQRPDPRANKEFRECERMAMEIKGILTSASQMNTGFSAQTPAGGAANGWTCSCGAVATGNFCPQCGAKKPVMQSAGSWTCGCGAVATGNFCPECGAKKPMAGGVRCDKCGWAPAPGENVPKFCPECGDPF